MSDKNVLLSEKPTRDLGVRDFKDNSTIHDTLILVIVMVGLPARGKISLIHQ
jgi:hypothetical protein